MQNTVFIFHLSTTSVSNKDVELNKHRHKLFAEGVLWDSPDIGILVEQISQANQLQFRGLYTHEGVASYQARGSQVKEVSNTTAERITHAANQYVNYDDLLYVTSHYTFSKTLRDKETL